MATHRVIPGGKVCQDCFLWMPAVDVVKAWMDCSRDKHRCADVVKSALSADSSLEPRIRATDSPEAPKPDDYARWNAEPFSHRGEPAAF